jgi:hypothetical protein
MHRVHEAFPLIVYQGMVDCHEKIKSNLDELRDYWFDGYQNESPEYSGRIFVHQKKSCKPFFEELRTHVDNYFGYLNVDYSKLDYHIIKSWVGYHQDDETPSVKPHNHNASDLSFVFYVKTDETSDKFCVAQEKNPNECVGDLFMEAMQRNLITGYNKYNCNVYSITPIEGSVVIFPSKIGHFTQKFTERQGERLVIPGDIRVTLKPQNPDYHQGSTHPSQWLQL